MINLSTRLSGRRSALARKNASVGDALESTAYEMEDAITQELSDRKLVAILDDWCPSSDKY